MSNIIHLSSKRHNCQRCKKYICAKNAIVCHQCKFLAPMGSVITHVTGFFLNYSPFTPTDPGTGDEPPKKGA